MKQIFEHVVKKIINILNVLVMKYTPNSGSVIESHGLRFMEITPIFLRGQKWFLIAFEEIEQNMGNNPHFALIYSVKFSNSFMFDIYKEILETFLDIDNIPVRIHSECLLGDAFGSDLCECGDQLQSALKYIVKMNKGILIYLRQEGRGIGFRAKLSCLALQEGYINGKRTETVHSSDEANLALGYKIDSRDYSLAVAFLKILNVNSVNLISGNPDKISSIKKGNINISKIIELPIRNLTKKHPRALKEIKEKIRRKYIYSKIDKYLNQSV